MCQPKSDSATKHLSNSKTQLLNFNSIQPFIEDIGDVRHCGYLAVSLALGYTLQACAPHKLHFLQDQQVTLVKSLTEMSLIVQNCELKWVCLTIGTYRII